MKVPVYNMAGEEVQNVELSPSIFEAKINRGLMHQALVRQLANGRRGTHKVKGRSEIRKSTAKIYRQKGTGNARHGSRRAPIFVGGGVAHGPQPRSYEKGMPRKMRRAALRSALSVKADSDGIVLVDELELEAPKTREMSDLIERLTEGESTLVLLADRNENVEKSSRNLEDVKILRANYLNIRDLLGYEKVIMPLSALDIVNAFLGLEDDVELADAVEAEEEA